MIGLRGWRPGHARCSTTCGICRRAIHAGAPIATHLLDDPPALIICHTCITAYPPLHHHLNGTTPPARRPRTSGPTSARRTPDA